MSQRRSAENEGEEAERYYLGHIDVGCKAVLRCVIDAVEMYVIDLGEVVCWTLRSLAEMVFLM